MPEQDNGAPAVPARATQGAEAGSDRDWSWVEASVWTERMVSALVTASKKAMAQINTGHGLFAQGGLLAATVHLVARYPR